MVSVIVGGQYGSEGKGRVSQMWAKKVNASAVVKVGGINSGHTVYDKKGAKHVLRVLPAGIVNTGATAVIAAGSYIRVDILLKEIEELGLSSDRLWIDPKVVLITDEMIYGDSSTLMKAIASTSSGTGEAVKARVSRDPNIKFARGCTELQKYITPTRKAMRSMLEDHMHIVIEGTQGYGLSNIHSVHYPYVTSRDTTAATFVSEAGLSPRDVGYVVMCLRSYPIRVGGTSGPLYKECSWKKIAEWAGTDEDLTEYTSVTNRVRRVGCFDYELVKQAIDANDPNVIVVNHADYWDYANKGNAQLSEKQELKLAEMETVLGRAVNYVGNGTDTYISRKEI